MYTTISRKVVGKNAYATVPKDNMGYAQYTVPDTVAVGCRTYFCCFPLALALAQATRMLAQQIRESFKIPFQLKVGAVICKRES